VAQVLFCGREFLDGFNFTAEELASEAGVSVQCCARSEVHQHIGDADMAVRAILERGSLWLCGDCAVVSSSDPPTFHRCPS
jgi:hypothetical protein